MNFTREFKMEDFYASSRHISRLEEELKKIDELVHKWAAQGNIRLAVAFMNAYGEIKGTPLDTASKDEK